MVSKLIFYLKYKIPNTIILHARKTTEDDDNVGLNGEMRRFQDR